MATNSNIRIFQNPEGWWTWTHVYENCDPDTDGEHDTFETREEAEENAKLFG